MNLGDILQGVLDSMFQSVLDNMVKPFAEWLTNTLFSQDAINGLFYVEPVFNAMRVIGIGILILVITWQSFKAMFAWAGFEADEPVRIALRGVIFGLLIWYSKDFMMFFVGIMGDAVTIVFHGIFEADYNLSLGGVVDWLANGTGGLFAISTILNIYIIFKCIGLFFKMFERMVLCSLLVICSPMAFACGVSQPTKGFFTGFVRVFTGNLLTQLMQTVCISALAMYQLRIIDDNRIWSMFIMIGIVKVCGKLEDIIRDMSINVGLGREFGGMMGKVSAAVNVSQQVVNVAKSFVK